MRVFFIISISLVMVSCHQNSDSADRAKLMELHHKSREAHFSKNAKVLVEGFSENFLSVNRGKIDSLTTREEHTIRFQKYFDAVKFKKWDDLTPPTIRFSNDHSLAYMTVNKLVVLETKDTVGNLMEETTHFAWIAIFRKQNNGDWKVECVASTNEPELVDKL